MEENDKPNPKPKGKRTVQKDASVIEFTDVQKNQIQLLIWKSVAAFALGIVAILGTGLIWYVNTQISNAKDEISALKDKGEGVIETIKNNAKKTHRIVALLSDFGSGAYYVSNFKGRIINQNPNANLLDISHEVRPFDVTEGAWILANAAKTLPQESIIWGIVNPGADLRTSVFIITKSPRHYLVGVSQSLFDNVVVNEQIEAAYRPNFSNDDDKFGTKTFAALVNALLSGDSVNQLIQKNLIQKEPIQFEPELASTNQPIWTENSVTGCVCSIDRWGNILTNIPKKNLFNLIGNYKYSVQIQSKVLANMVYGISYNAGIDKPGVIVDQDGWIQIAIFGKAASNHFGINKSGLKITIRRSP